MRLVFLNNNHRTVNAICTCCCLIKNNAGGLVDRNTLAVTNVDGCFLNVSHSYGRVDDLNVTVFYGNTTTKKVLHSNGRIYDSKLGTVEAVLHLCIYTVSITADVNSRVDDSGVSVSNYTTNVVQIHSCIADIKSSGSLISLEHATVGVSITLKIPLTAINVDLTVCADIEDTICGGIALANKIYVDKIKSSTTLCKNEYAVNTCGNTADINCTVLKSEAGVCTDLVFTNANGKCLTVKIDSKIDRINIKSSGNSYVNTKLNNVTAISCCESLLEAEVISITDVCNDVTTVYKISTISVSIAVAYVYLETVSYRSSKLVAPVVSVSINSNTGVICYCNIEVSYATLGSNSVLFHRKISVGCATTNNDSCIALCTVGVNNVVSKSNNGSRAVSAALTETNCITINVNGRVLDFNIGRILNVKTVLRLNSTTVNYKTVNAYNLNEAVHGFVNSTVNDRDVLIASSVGLNSSNCAITTSEGTTLNGYVGDVTIAGIILVRYTEVDAIILRNIGCIEVKVLNGKATCCIGCAVTVNSNSAVESLAITVDYEIKIRRSFDSEVAAKIYCKCKNVTALSCCKSFLKAEVAILAYVNNNVTACYEISTISVSIAVAYVYLESLSHRSSKLVAPIVSVSINSDTGVICYCNIEVSYATLGSNSVLFHRKISVGCATTNNDSCIALCTVGVNNVVSKSNNGSRAVSAALTETNCITINVNGRVLDFNIGRILNVKTVLRLNSTTVNYKTVNAYNLNEAVHGFVNSTVNDRDVLIASSVGLNSSNCAITTSEGTTLNGYVGDVTIAGIILVRYTEVDAIILRNIGCIEVKVLNGKATCCIGCAVTINSNSTVEDSVVTNDSKVNLRISNDNDIFLDGALSKSDSEITGLALERSNCICEAEEVIIAYECNSITACYELSEISVRIAFPNIYLDSGGYGNSNVLTPIVLFSSNSYIAGVCHSNIDMRCVVFGSNSVLFHRKRSLGCATTNNNSCIF